MQFILFCGVGASNTLLDFLIYNILTRHPLSVGRVLASCASCTVAILWSFLLNSSFVFAGGAYPANVVVRFIAVTLFSSYVIQSGVIAILSSRGKGTMALITNWLPKSVPWLESECIEGNLVKAVAVGCGLLWNFFWYKYFVFAVE